MELLYQNYFKSSAGPKAFERGWEEIVATDEATNHGFVFLLDGMNELPEEYKEVLKIVYDEWVLYCDTNRLWISTQPSWIQQISNDSRNPEKPQNEFEDFHIRTVIYKIDNQGQIIDENQVGGNDAIYLQPAVLAGEELDKFIDGHLKKHNFPPKWPIEQMKDWLRIHSTGDLTSSRQFVAMLCSETFQDQLPKSVFDAFEQFTEDRLRKSKVVDHFKAFQWENETTLNDQKEKTIQYLQQCLSLLGWQMTMSHREIITNSGDEEYFLENWLGTAIQIYNNIPFFKSTSAEFIKLFLQLDSRGVFYSRSENTYEFIHSNIVKYYYTLRFLKDVLTISNGQLEHARSWVWISMIRPLIHKDQLELFNLLRSLFRKNNLPEGLKQLEKESLAMVKTASNLPYGPIENIPHFMTTDTPENICQYLSQFFSEQLDERPIHWEIIEHLCELDLKWILKLGVGSKLVTLLKEPYFWVHWDVVNVLRKLGGEGIETLNLKELFVERLEALEEWEIYRGGKVLVELGVKRSEFNLRKLFVAWLEDPNEWVCREAVKVLGELGVKGIKTLDLEELFVDLLNNSEEGVRQAAVEVLAKLGVEIIETLNLKKLFVDQLKALESRFPQVVVEVLGELGVEGIKALDLEELFVDLLENLEYGVRERESEVPDEFEKRDEEIEKFVGSLVVRPEDTDEKVHQAVIKVLKQLGVGVLNLGLKVEMLYRLISEEGCIFDSFTKAPPEYLSQILDTDLRNLLLFFSDQNPAYLKDLAKSPEYLTFMLFESKDHEIPSIPQLNQGLLDFKLKAHWLCDHPKEQKTLEKSWEVLKKEISCFALSLPSLK